MGSDPKKRDSNLNPTIGNVYFGATDKRETGDIGDPNDWITLNTDLKNYSNPNYNNRSKVYRVIVPTEQGLAHEGFQGLTDYETRCGDRLLSICVWSMISYMMLS